MSSCDPVGLSSPVPAAADGGRRGDPAVQWLWWPGLLPSAVVVLLAGLVLLGWYMPVPELVDLRPGWIPMARNTAAGYLLEGLALIGSILGHPRMRLLAILGVALGLFSLVEDLLNIPLGVDGVLLPAGGTTPVRTPLYSAIVLTVAGLAMLASPAGGRTKRFTVALTSGGALAAVLGLMATIGYAFDVPPGYGWGIQKQIAPQGAVCALLLGSGMIAAAWRVNPYRVSPYWLVEPIVLGGVTLALAAWWAFAAIADLRAAEVPARTATSAIVGAGLAFSMLLALAVSAAWRAQELAHVMGSLEGEVNERHHAERLYRTIVRNYPGGTISLVDHDLRYLVADGAGLRTVGLSTEMLVGRTIWEALPPELGAQVVPAVRAAFQGETTTWDVTVEEHVFRAHALPVRDEDGRVVASMTMTTDVTAERRAEAALRQANEELEQRVADRTAALRAANAELESFSYSVSHDLRAPLRAMSGFARILLDDHGASLSAGAVDCVDSIGVSAKRMGQLIDDLLGLSRVQRTPFEPETVDLTGLVRGVWRDLAPERAGRRAELRIGALPPCQGDPRLLVQVLVNLLGNALKFTRQRATTEVEVGACDKGGCCAYFVRDNGAGFDMRYAGKLFEVFQRLHAREQYEGTGIGLALVQRIVTRHGGEVWAESEPDRGATFYFTIGGRTDHD